MPCYDGHVDDRVPTRVRLAEGLCVGLGLAAIVWLVAALWPRGGWPAWPTVSLGVLAIGCGLLPGRALPRGLGSFAGVLGIGLGGAQIAVLWGIALFTP